MDKTTSRLNRLIHNIFKKSVQLFSSNQWSDEFGMSKSLFWVLSINNNTHFSNFQQEIEVRRQNHKNNDQFFLRASKEQKKVSRLRGWIIFATQNYYQSSFTRKQKSLLILYHLIQNWRVGFLIIGEKRWETLFATTMPAELQSTTAACQIKFQGKRDKIDLADLVQKVCFQLISMNKGAMVAHMMFIKMEGRHSFQRFMDFEKNSPWDKFQNPVTLLHRAQADSKSLLPGQRCEDFHVDFAQNGFRPIRFGNMPLT